MALYNTHIPQVEYLHRYLQIQLKPPIHSLRSWRDFERKHSRVKWREFDCWYWGLISKVHPFFAQFLITKLLCFKNIADTLLFVLSSELSWQKCRLFRLHHETPVSSFPEKHVNSFGRTTWHTSRVASFVLVIFNPTLLACHPTWRMTLKDCVLTTVPLFLCSTAVSRERLRSYPWLRNQMWG